MPALVQLYLAYSTLIPFRPIGHRVIPGRWFVAGVITLAAITTPLTKSALAQPSAQWSPRVSSPGDEINLFADWTPTEPTDGLTIDVRDGWDVLSVEAVGLARNDKVEFTLRRSVEGVFAEADERLIGRHRLIITLRSPLEDRSSTIYVVPTRRVTDVEGVRLEPVTRHEVEFDVDVAESSYSAGRALLLRPSDRRGIEADAAAGFETKDQSGLTVAFWVKSVDLGQIILSSWDGSQYLDYPFEFVVEASGEVRLYTSEAGMHYSLGSGLPVADGSWHHIGYSVRFDDGFAFMTVDGEEVDSRFLPNPADDHLKGIAFGSRRGEEVAFDGLIDELLIEPQAKTAEEISRLTRVPVDALEIVPASMAFGFDRTPSSGKIRGVNDETDLVASDLTLHQPVTDVVAEFQTGQVSLTWKVERPEAQVITVERSKDGLVFDQIHELVIRDPDLDHLHEGQAFSYEDFVSEDTRISFYRIRQEFTDRSVIQSAMIKVGMGALEVPTKVELIGNSPNPFSTSTEVYYRVNHSTQVRLSVWSVSGHLAEILVNETQEPGLHREPFDAGGLPSGTYFVRLETDEGVQTTKMILRR